MVGNAESHWWPRLRGFGCVVGRCRWPVGHIIGAFLDPPGSTVAYPWAWTAGRLCVELERLVRHRTS